jgi:quercetin dioxygenase-like cupin family protein
MNAEDIIKQLTKEGFEGVALVPIPANFNSGLHTHEDPSVHIIVSGELTIIDPDGSSKTYKPGDRVEFPAGTTHTAKGGMEEGSMIVGIKKQYLSL